MLLYFSLNNSHITNVLVYSPESTLGGQQSPQHMASIIYRHLVWHINRNKKPRYKNKTLYLFNIDQQKSQHHKNDINAKTFAEVINHCLK